MRVIQKPSTSLPSSRPHASALPSSRKPRTSDSDHGTSRTRLMQRSISGHAADISWRWTQKSSDLVANLCVESKAHYSIKAACHHHAGADESPLLAKVTHT